MASTIFTKRDRCPSCGEKQITSLYGELLNHLPIRNYLQRHYAEFGDGIDFDLLQGGVFALVECNHCALVYQEQIPDDHVMEILYERWLDPAVTYALHENHDDLRRHAIYAQGILQLLGYFKRLPSEITCLDFGMGWGKWARMAQAFGCQCHGFELSPARIAHAQAHGIPVVSWDEIPQHGYDFINADQVFEHLPAPLGTLRHLASALKPTGLVRISVPDGTDVKRRLRVMDWSAPKGSRNSLNPVSPLEHINCFNRNALLTMASLAGLELFKMPLTIRYRYSIAGVSLRFTVRNLIQPLLQNIFHRGTDVLLRKKSNHTGEPRAILD